MRERGRDGVSEGGRGREGKMMERGRGREGGRKDGR